MVRICLRKHFMDLIQVGTFNIFVRDDVVKVRKNGDLREAKICKDTSSYSTKAGDCLEDFGKLMQIAKVLDLTMMSQV